MAIDNSTQKSPAENTVLRWGAIAGAVAAILGLIFLLFPRLKPEDPPELDAKISAVALERDIALETYLKRNNRPTPRGFTCVELMSNGMLVKPTVELTGLKGQTVHLRWSMYEAGAERLVPANWYPDRVLFSPPKYTPMSQRDKWIFEYWLPYPRAQGEYFARLELIAQDKGRLRSLGYSDTKPVQVTLLPECAGPPPHTPYPPDVQIPSR